MAAERPAGEALNALARVLGRAGQEPPTGRELAELLWLARQLGPAPERGPARAPQGDRTPLPVTRPPAPVPAAPRPEPAAVPEPRVTEAAGPAPAPAPRVPLHTPAAEPAPEPAAGSPHTALLAPAPPMLARPLALQRSLRPLRRTVPSATGRELDEAATADRIAALGDPRPRLWPPVLRPRQERWLHLRIVFDSGPTMTMWRPLVRELHTVLAQTGAFRTLDVLRLGEDGLLPRRHRERGRTAVLVISDGMGPQWRAEPAGLRWRGALAALAREAPVAVLQPLPERLWRHTALPTVPGRFAAPAAGVPNAALDFTPYDDFARYEDGAGAAGLPVPVLEPTDVWLGHWAALIASPAGTEVPGAAAFVTPGGPTAPDDALVPEDTDPEELVLRFRALASPQAFRLAAHLAVGSAQLPVMRLVQAAIEERPEPQHLAEVVLSGMLRAHPGAAPGAYEFRPGVREVLLGTLPRSSLVRTAELLARVSAEIDARAGALPGEFRALVESLAGRGAERAAGQPFALVSEESVRLLRGPERGRAPAPRGAPPDGAAGGGLAPPPLDGDRYEVYERLGGTTVPVWRGYDRYLQRQVALSYFPYPAFGEPVWVGRPGRDRRSAGADFLARTYEVARIVAPHVVKVFDAVVLDQGCCLVTELVPGRSLRQRLDEVGGPLPVTEAVTIAQGVLSGLWALHHRGTRVPHGDLTPSKVLGVDDGLPRLCGYGLARPYPPPHDDPDRTGRFPLAPVPGRPATSGTARYLAPERQDGELLVEGDLYSLGCILHEMLTGAPPVTGRDLRTVLRRHAEGVTPDSLSLDPELPAELRQAVAALLSRSPRERQRGAVQLANLRLAGRLRRTTSDYRLLGRPQAYLGGRNVSTDAYQNNAFLCRLLAARGAPVSAAEMAEALAEKPRIRPQQYALHLQALGIPVRTLDDGYLLDVPDAFLDVGRAENLAAQAERAQARGDTGTARSKLRQALHLWYGEPLEGVVGAWAEGERGRLLALRDTLAGRLATLEAPGAMSPGWLVIDPAHWAAEAREVREIVSALAREACGGASLSARTTRPVQAPIPPGTDPLALVEWAVDTFPYELAAMLPAGVRQPVRLSVVVHDETEAAASALAGAGREAGATGEGGAVVVTVLISHGLRARLTRSRRKDFGTITATAGGWRHTVVARPPEPRSGRRPGRGW
ncbi:SAV_2336 N-terminal domain-related protein [Streptomyces sp. NPDC053431]|uniref:SAV_2336 N-terminal domain-related protein n=1 Tax=Streptomyces sp. NPDC053431 TaxID=3365703 RepID=UPI0037D1699B